MEKTGTLEQPSESVVTGQKGERRAPMERPSIDEGITESDWSFFLAEWSRYKEATAITGPAAVRHLWQCCSETLCRALHNMEKRRCWN